MPASLRLPSIDPERDAPASQPDPFLLEPDPLREHAAGPRAPADAAGGVHDPVPGHAARAVAHGGADRAGRAGLAHERRHLTVRHHAPPRDPPHEAVDGGAEVHAADDPACSS
jgi:hypothetical protein